jgi:predicted RND superfamily exporter protein
LLEILNGLTSETPTGMDSPERHSYFMIQNMDSLPHNGYEDFVKKLEKNMKIQPTPKQAKEKVQVEADKKTKSEVSGLDNVVVKVKESAEKVVNKDLEENMDSKAQSIQYVEKALELNPLQLVNKAQSEDITAEISDIDSPRKNQIEYMNNKYSPKRSPRIAQIMVKFNGASLKKKSNMSKTKNVSPKKKSRKMIRLSKTKK